MQFLLPKSGLEFVCIFIFLVLRIVDEILAELLYMLFKTA